MNAIGVILTCICSLLVIGGSRRWAALGVMGAVCYITQGQQFVALLFHFTAVRFVLLAALIRLLFRREFREVHLNDIDKSFLGYVTVISLCTGVRAMGSTNPDSPFTVVTVIGGAYDMLLAYFVFRGLVRDAKELEDLLEKIALLIVPLGLSMVLEAATRANIFSVMGGWQGGEWEREGRLRCVGSFRGPHTVGIFGATLVALIFPLWFSPQKRKVAVGGLAAAMAMAYTSNSSGPTLAFVCVLIALCFWGLRLHMRQVRRGIVVALVGLALSMKVPIWYLFAKISDVIGGDGWHRSYLMDQCAQHISRWWLMGTDDTGDWARTVMSWGGADLCNQYVSAAAGGGLVALLLLVVVLVKCFNHLGKGLRMARSGTTPSERTFWCLGSALFAHVVALFSITYSDQMYVPWWGLLGIISSTTSDIMKRGEAAELVVGIEAPATVLRACSKVMGG